MIIVCEFSRKSFRRNVLSLFRHFQVKKPIMVHWFYCGDILETFKRVFFEKKISRGHFQTDHLKTSKILFEKHYFS